ncbi:MAG: YdgA family protein [Campylobacteraceae bacterium]|nr:YdgA family protein [Campylobacteraceae bacterium]
MAKKIVATMLLCLGFNGLFALDSNTTDGNVTEVESMLSNSKIFTFIKREAAESEGFEKGYFEGKITREEAENRVTNFIQTFSNFGVSKEEVDSLIADFKESGGVPSDIDFRYDYELKYLGESLEKGFDMDGKITILTPEYAAIAQAFFGTYAPLNLKISKTLEDAKVKLSLAEINQFMDDNQSEALKLSGVELSWSEMAEKLKDFGFKFGDFETGSEFDKILVKNAFFNIDFKDGTLKDMSNVMESNFKSSIGFGEVSVAGVTLLNMINNADMANDSGRLHYITELKLDEILAFGMGVKNLKYQDELFVDEEFYSFLTSKASALAMEDENVTIEEFKSKFGNGIKYTLKELSLENSAGNKLSLDLALDMAKLYDTPDENIQNLNLSGNFAIYPNFLALLTPYGEYAMFGAMIDAYEGFKKDDSKTSLSFENKNGEFFLNGEKMENPLLGMFDSEEEGSDDYTDEPESDEDIAQLAANLNILTSEIVMYYNVSGGFSDQGVSAMTKILVVDSSKTSADFLVEGKKCIEINLFEKSFTITKGAESSDEACEELYSIPSVETLLGTGEFRLGV